MNYIFWFNFNSAKVVKNSENFRSTLCLLSPKNRKFEYGCEKFMKKKRLNGLTRMLEIWHFLSGQKVDNNISLKLYFHVIYYYNDDYFYVIYNLNRL
jgi:hypothetical protein